VPQDIEASYRDMAADRAREQEALEWSEAQIATVGKQRLKSKLATLSPDDVRAIERAICIQLGLSTS
jgi:hypothetical protein